MEYASLIHKSERRIHLQLSHAITRFVFAIFLAGCCCGYIYFAATIWLGAHYAAKSDLQNVMTAIRLRPRNAEYQYQLGQLFLVAQPSAEEALKHFLAAVNSNPYHARAWFGLAEAYQSLGNVDGQKIALEKATAADPTTPQFAWQAANLYVTQGDTSNALRQLKTVMQHDPGLSMSAIRLAWRIMPDMDALLRDSVPLNAQVYQQFLEYLVSQKESTALASLWRQLVAAGLPIERRYVFEYTQFLILNNQPAEAASAWSQTAQLSGLQAYQPTSSNLVVNGDFSSDILNGGFDWLCQQSSNVGFALDPTQSHGGHRSLLLNFDSRGLTESGLRQFIAVSPNTSYEFSAYFKMDDLRGAGGPQFAIQDAYTPEVFFISMNLTDVDYWKQVNGTFTTGPSTQLIVLHVQRTPAGSPIRGKLWIDDIRLVPYSGKPDAQ